jgi:hypothetical protein
MNSHVTKLFERAARMPAIRAPRSLAAAGRSALVRACTQRRYPGDFTS